MFTKKKYYVIFGIILLMIAAAIGSITWYFTTHIKYHYDADSLESYEIDINYNSGVSKIHKSSVYSVSDGVTSTTSSGEEQGTITQDYEITLTKDECKSFKTAHKINEKNVLDALVCISKDDAIMFEDASLFTFDYDSDGVITYREYGNYLLSYISSTNEIQTTEN